MARNGNPTIKDVALACGVSEATVSYVINGKRVLRPATRERVAQAIREMNYHPSAVARGLSSKRLHTIGIVLGAVNPVDFIVNTYAAGLLQGIVAQAQRDGFNVTLFTEQWKNAEISGAGLRDGRTDGILVIGPPIECDIVETLRSVNVPAVGISSEPSAAIPSVDVDNYVGAKLATQHLLRLGHRRIAHLTGNPNLSSYKPRLAGFQDALREAGIEPFDGSVVISDFNAAPTPGQTQALLSLPEPPTAIFASNDIIAMAAINGARGAGADVPRDLSVVGFDDMPSSFVFTPKLTTIQQPLADIGAKATHLLIDKICHPDRREAERDQILIEPRLIVRDSTRPPSSKATV